MEKKIMLELDKNRETKGAIRYGDGDNHSFYLRKSEISTPYPEKIKLTIDVIK